MRYLDFTVDRPLLEQFAEQWPDCRLEGCLLHLPPDLTHDAAMRLAASNNQIELYVGEGEEMIAPWSFKTFCPPDSDWFLLLVNLASDPLVRSAKGARVGVQREAPSGILLYTPGTVVEGVNPAGVKARPVFVRFHRDVLGDAVPDCLTSRSGAILYESLGYMMEKALERATNPEATNIARFSALFDFMSQLMTRLAMRDEGAPAEAGLDETTKALFPVAGLLRNPKLETIPSIEELAAMAGMSPTRFKALFRLVFGCPPVRFHQQIRMEYARGLLAEGGMSPTEVSYSLGYSHPSKFSQAFKREFGITPSKALP